MTNLEQFLNQYKDNIYYSIDENSISVAVGCELNFVELERIKSIVSKYFSNFIIINTCGVHEKNTEISKQIVSELIKENPNSTVFIVGCASKLFINFTNDNVIIANNEEKISEEFYASLPNACKQDGIKEHQIGKIKIQTGCNSNCAYCIIPKLRGKSQSETYESIKQNIQNNLDDGVFDICLVGVNIVQYKEPNDGYGLVQLVKNIIKDFPSIHSLNLDSIDPAYLEIFDLIDFIKQEGRMRKELYLATQSGSDKIIKAMRRCHTRQRILDIIKAASGIEIRHDFIVGFPGETDEDFEQTRSLLRLTQNKERYGVISEYTNHFGEQEDLVPIDVIKKRKDILEAQKSKIIELINSDSGIIELTCDSDFGKIKKYMDQDKIKAVTIKSDLGANFENVVSGLKILMDNKPRYQKVILHTSCEFSDEANKICSMFPEVIIDIE